MQPHSQGPQRETEHETRGNEFEHIDSVDAGKTRSAYDQGEREHTKDHWESDVSPRRTTIRHTPPNSTGPREYTWVAKPWPRHPILAEG